MPTLPEVVVYHAEGCHLCEAALERTRALHAELGFAYREVAIDGDPELEAAYREWLPVVEIDGERRFTYVVDPDELRRALAQATADS